MVLQGQDKEPADGNTACDGIFGGLMKRWKKFKKKLAIRWRGIRKRLQNTWQSTKRRLLKKLKKVKKRPQKKWRKARLVLTVCRASHAMLQGN